MASDAWQPAWQHAAFSDCHVIHVWPETGVNHTYSKRKGRHCLLYFIIIINYNRNQVFNAEGLDTRAEGLQGLSGLLSQQNFETSALRRRSL